VKDEPIRCCRCGVEVKDRLDDTAHVRLGLLFGPRLSVLWKQDAPWKYLDLCIGCARAFDEWVEAGPGIPRPSRTSPADSEAPLARRLRDKVKVGTR
jgi:hypothetical protein